MPDFSSTLRRFNLTALAPIIGAIQTRLRAIAASLELSLATGDNRSAIPHSALGAPNWESLLARLRAQSLLSNLCYRVASINKTLARLALTRRQPSPFESDSSMDSPVSSVSPSSSVSKNSSSTSRPEPDSRFEIKTSKFSSNPHSALHTPHSGVSVSSSSSVVKKSSSSSSIPKSEIANPKSSSLRPLPARYFAPPRLSGVSGLSARSIRMIPAIPLLPGFAIPRAPAGSPRTIPFNRLQAYAERTLALADKYFASSPPPLSPSSQPAAPVAPSGSPSEISNFKSSIDASPSSPSSPSPPRFPNDS